MRLEKGRWFGHLSVSCEMLVQGGGGVPGLLLALLGKVTDKGAEAINISGSV